MASTLRLHDLDHARVGALDEDVLTRRQRELRRLVVVPVLPELEGAFLAAEPKPVAVRSDPAHSGQVELDAVASLAVAQGGPGSSVEVPGPGHARCQRIPSEPGVVATVAGGSAAARASAAETVVLPEEIEGRAASALAGVQGVGALGVSHVHEPVAIVVDAVVALNGCVTDPPAEDESDQTEDDDQTDERLGPPTEELPTCCVLVPLFACEDVDGQGREDGTVSQQTTRSGHGLDEHPGEAQGEDHVQADDPHDVVPVSAEVHHVGLVVRLVQEEPGNQQANQEGGHLDVGGKPSRDGQAREGDGADDAGDDVLAVHDGILRVDR